MNMIVLYKKCTYGLLLIATTIIGGLNFCDAGSYTINGSKTISYNSNNSTSVGTSNLFNIPIYSNLSTSIGEFSLSCTISNLNNGGIIYTVDNSGHGIAVPFYYLNSNTQATNNSIYSNSVFDNGNYVFNFNDSTAIYGQHIRFYAYYSRPISSSTVVSFDYSCTVSGNNILSFDGNNCSPSGQCTVSDKVSENILFTGSKSFSTSYSNMFNYGTEGAGTYCLKFTSSNPQTLTMGFANGGTTTPTNLYSLYNDQYGNWICLYGNKPYLNVKLNASSNTIDYEVYKLTDLLNDNIPCSNSGGGSCDYSDYELKSDITENYCKNKYSSLITQGECNSTYSGYVAPNIYQICTNSLNSCSNELTTCNTTLTSCINGNFTGNVMRSALYINNVQHLSNDNIYITIPEEIERDYVNIDDETDIEITGYGYDQNAMQEMVNTQFTPPSAEDMENVIAKVADFLPLVAIMLLIVYAWWLIKKVF